MDDLHGTDGHPLGEFSLGSSMFIVSGPAWLDNAKPAASNLKPMLLDTDYSNVIPGHGDPISGGANEKYRFMTAAIRTAKHTQFLETTSPALVGFFTLPGKKWGRGIPPSGSQIVQVAAPY